jgi:two-component system chemotaxis response regulator CheB
MIPPAVPADALVRVLLVDDSAVVRNIVSRTLGAEADIEVVGTARDGRHALAQVKDLQPDVVVLDVEMPVLDGLETLPQLRELSPHLPVVMYSTLTERGAATTLEALARGAVDFATKPTMVTNSEEAAAVVRRNLLPLVRTWGRIGQARRGRTRGPAGFDPTPTGGAEKSLGHPPLVLRRASRPRGPVTAVVIGSSTGGPNALAEVIPALPSSFPVPVLIVQHMPEVFTKLLAERLDARSQLSVREGQEGDIVRRGRVYIAPGGKHLVVRRGEGQAVLACTDGPPENFCRPAVDVLFRSAVEVWGGGLLAVMLTGMGNDGLAGSRAIDEAGGMILAQDEDTSVVWGMPGAVVRAGLAREVLPLEGIAPAIVGRVTRTVADVSA